MNRDTDADELGGGPETGNEYPSQLPDVPEGPAFDITASRSRATMVPRDPPSSPNPAHLPGDAEFFASIVGAMLDEKLKHQEDKFAGAMVELTTALEQIGKGQNELKADVNITKGVAEGLRDEMRPRLANLEEEGRQDRAARQKLQHQVDSLELEFADVKRRLADLETAEP